MRISRSGLWVSVRYGWVTKAESGESSESVQPEDPPAGLADCAHCVAHRVAMSAMHTRLRRQALELTQAQSDLKAAELEVERLRALLPF